MKVAEKYTDIELIDAISRDKDLDKAILFLYQQYAASTSSFIIHYGASAQDADDIFQETVLAFINIIKKGKYRMEATVKTFLVSIAKNIWLNEVKKRERTGQREKRYGLSGDQQQEDVSDQLSDLENKKQIRELVNKLGEPCRKLLVLFYYDNLSMKELVDHLPYENEQVVRNKKYKCLQQLIGFVKNNPAIAGKINEMVK